MFRRDDGVAIEFLHHSVCGSILSSAVMRQLVPLGIHLRMSSPDKRARGADAKKQSRTEPMRLSSQTTCLIYVSIMSN